MATTQTTLVVTEFMRQGVSRAQVTLLTVETLRQGVSRAQATAVILEILVTKFQAAPPVAARRWVQFF